MVLLRNKFQIVLVYTLLLVSLIYLAYAEYSNLYINGQPALQKLISEASDVPQPMPKHAAASASETAASAGLAQSWGYSVSALSSPAGNGYLWLLNSSKGVYKVDLQTGDSVFNFTPSGLQVYNGIEFMGTNIWLIGSKSGGTNYLQKYDLSGNFISETALQNVNNGYDLAWDDIYFSFIVNDKTVSGPIFSRVTLSGNASKLIDDPISGSFDIAFYGGILWVNSNELNKIYEIDPYSGAVYYQFSPNIAATSIGGLAYGESKVWLASFSEGRIYRFDTYGTNELSFSGPSQYIIAASYQPACACDNWAAQGCALDGCGSREMYYTRTCIPSSCDIQAQCVNEPWNCFSCSGTDTSCGVYPNCVNCNANDGCDGNYYRDYYCSGTSCGFTQDNCNDCSCNCGGYNTAENPANGNCNDGKDNDCDGKTDSADPGCSGNCSYDWQCGTAHWKNSPFCYFEYVWDTWVELICINPGTASSYCSNLEYNVSIQSCYDYLDSWGSSYCKNGNVYHNRTYHDQTCSSGVCYDDQSVEEEIVQYCHSSCSKGRCVDHCQDGAQNYGEGGVDCGGDCDYSCSIPVILLHGYLAQNSSLIEIDSWLRAQGYKVYNIEYSPGNALSNGDIRDYADYLAAKIFEVRAQEKSRQVDIVAHSMGGLVARWYANEHGMGEIRKLIMLGTPNHGSSRAKNVKSFAYGAKILFNPHMTQEVVSILKKFDSATFGYAGYQMRPCSTFLNELNFGNPAYCEDRESNYPNKVKEDNLAYGVQHHVAAGYTDNFLDKLWALKVGPNDGFVAVTSAVLDGANNANVYSLHGQLVNNTNVFNWIKQILDNSTIPQGMMGEGMLSFSAPADSFSSAESAGAYSASAYFGEQATSDASSNYEELAQFDGNISDGETKNHSAYIFAAKNASFTLASFAYNLTFYLADPIGMIINTSNCNSGNKCIFSSDDTFRSFGIEYPKNGTWGIFVKPNGILDSNDYSIFVAADSEIGLNVVTDKVKYNMSEQVNIRANLSRRGSKVINANLTAFIQKPDYSAVQLKLYDDGSHNDLYSQDGVYGNNFNGADQYGGYIISAEANGNISGSNFSARQGSSFWVEATPDLAVSNITFSEIAANEGESVIIKAGVRNLEAVESPNTTAIFYENGIFGRNYLGDSSADLGLASGAELSITVANLSSGLHNISAVVSPDFVDRNYSNNELSSLLAVLANNETFLNDISQLKLEFGKGYYFLRFVKVNMTSPISEAYFIIPQYNQSVTRMDIDLMNDGVVDYKNYNGSGTVFNITPFIQNIQLQNKSMNVPVVFSSDSAGSAFLSNITFTYDNSFFLSIANGWNLITVPGTAEETINSEAIFAFDNAKKKYFSADVNASMPIWLKSPNFQNPRIRQVNLSIVFFNLTRGWNLVPYNSFFDKQISTALANVSGQYKTVFGYEGQWKKYGDGPADSLLYFRKGGSYWIYLYYNQTWYFDPKKGEFYNANPFVPACAENSVRDCGSNIGECRYGTQTCINGGWGGCAGGINATWEACPYDGKDNDCDGQTDENYCSNNYCINSEYTHGGNRRLLYSEFGPFCADKRDWKFKDINNDGKNEFYMLAGDTYRVWLHCQANTSQNPSNYVKNFTVQNFTTCYDGACNNASELYLYERQYVLPANITYPEWGCYVCNSQGNCSLEVIWGPNTLFACYYSGDLYYNATTCNPFPPRAYVAVGCGANTDCTGGKTCYKFSNPLNNYCG